MVFKNETTGAKILVSGPRKGALDKPGQTLDKEKIQKLAKHLQNTLNISLSTQTAGWIDPIEQDTEERQGEDTIGGVAT